EQFFQESQQIIPAVGDAMISGRLDAIGPLIDRSQQLAEMMLGNQVEQTVFLARSARELGAVAASAFGAGFGGSVWALIPHQQSADFLQRWRTQYVQQFPADAARASFFVTRPGNAATAISR